MSMRPGYIEKKRTGSRITGGPGRAGGIIESGEEMSKLLNDYFLSVYTRENQDTIPVGEEVFQGDENEKLRDVIITRHFLVPQLP